jgi:hypothetical protein
MPQKYGKNFWKHGENPIEIGWGKDGKTIEIL